MPAFGTDGGKAIVVKSIIILFFQGNVNKYYSIVYQKVKIAICAGDERVA